MDYKKKYLKYKNKYLKENKQKGGGKYKDKYYIGDMDWNLHKHKLIEEILLVIKEFEILTRLKYCTDLNDFLTDLLMHTAPNRNGLPGCTEIVEILVEHLIENPDLFERCYPEEPESTLERLHFMVQ